MVLKQQKQTPAPVGEQTGIIKAARETSRSFGNFDDNGKPIKDATVEIVIQPDFKQPGAQTLDLSVFFSPSLNGLSALSQLLERLDATPPEGSDWNPGTLAGMKVRFNATRNERGFLQVEKNSIRKA